MTLSDCGVAVSPQTQVEDHQLRMPVFSFWISCLDLPPYAEVLHLILRRSALLMVGQEKGIRWEEVCLSKLSR